VQKCLKYRKIQHWLPVFDPDPLFGHRRQVISLNIVESAEHIHPRDDVPVIYVDKLSAAAAAAAESQQTNTNGHELRLDEVDGAWRSLQPIRYQLQWILSDFHRQRFTHTNFVCF